MTQEGRKATSHREKKLRQSDSIQAGEMRRKAVLFPKATVGPFVAKREGDISRSSNHVGEPIKESLRGGERMA